MNQPLAVHVSNRQFNVMGEAAQDHGISLSRMMQISQVTVGGIFRRGYMHWNKKTGMFQLTQSGLQVMKQYAHTDVDRKNTSRPLSQYIPANRTMETLKPKSRKAAA